MKIAITGHSKGIGKALYDNLSIEHDVEGFSRTNGFNIATDTDMIIRAVKKSDVFVNNAFHGMAQMIILNKLWELWKYDETKTIVNIVSLSKYPGLSSNETGYSALKAALYHQAFLLMFSDRERRCRMINVNPGYVKTAMTSHVKDNVNMLTPEECAEPIAYAINLPHHVEIGELSLWRPF
jgi:hypothetical protein